MDVDGDTSIPDHLEGSNSALIVQSGMTNESALATFALGYNYPFEWSRGVMVIEGCNEAERGHRFWEGQTHILGLRMPNCDIPMTREGDLEWPEYAKLPTYYMTMEFREDPPHYPNLWPCELPLSPS